MKQVLITRFRFSHAMKTGKTGHGSFVDGKKVAWLAPKVDLKGDPNQCSFCDISFRSLINLNATNSISGNSKMYENLMYLFQHLRQWEIPSLSLGSLHPQRILYWLKCQ